MILGKADFIVITIYFVGLAAFGLLVRRISGFNDYSVARRAVPTAMIFASLSATYIGPGYTMGLAGRAYSSGFLFLILFLLFSVQTILVGMFIAPRLNRFKEAHTLGDVIGSLYGRESQLLTGLISVGLCVGFAAVMARAGGAVLSELLSRPLWVGVLLITGVGVIYTYTGGLKSVIATEAIQFVIMVIGISVLTLLAWQSLDSLTGSSTFGFEATIRSFKELSAFQVAGLALSFLLGETLIPPYANRALAASSASASRLGFGLAGAFSILWFGMVSAIGVMSIALLGAGVAEDRVFMSLAAKVLPSGLLGLIVVAVAAIVMSSQESVLNAAAVAFTRDLVEPLRPASAERSLRLSKICTLAFGTLAIFLALRAPSIIDGLLVCYSIWAPSMMPALLWGVVGGPTSRWYGFVSILGGASGSVLTLLAGPWGGDSAISILVGLTVSTIAPIILFILRRIFR